MELRNLWLAGLAIATTVAAHPQHANNPGIALQGPDHYSLLVGDVKITALSDGTVPQDLHVLLRSATNEKTETLLAESFFPTPLKHPSMLSFFKTGTDSSSSIPDQASSAGKGCLRHFENAFAIPLGI
jgi:hypothetical protein